MGWFSREVRSVLLGPFGSGDAALARLFGRGPSDAGISVNETSALGYAPFWSAVTLIANVLATVPLHLYARDGGDGRARQTGDPVDGLVSLDASSESTAYEFRRSMQFAALVYGNSYAEILRKREDQRPAELHYIDPWAVTVERDPATQRLRYHVAQTGGREALLEPRDVLHVRGPSHNGGVTGLSVLNQARGAIGLGLATEKFGATFFGNGSTFGGTLSHPGHLNTESQKRLRESIESRHQGVDRAHRFLILEEGLKFESLGIPPEHSQFLQTRTWQVVEVARFFNMPSSLLSAVHEGSSLTYRNVAEEAQRFVDWCLLPWATAWEQELGRKLLPTRERDSLYFAHTFAGLLKGDLATRYAAFKTGVEGGWLSANDVRTFEDMNPIDGGDAYRTPAAPAASPEAPPTNGNNNGQPARVSLLAARSLLEDTLRRSLNREGDRVERAAKSFAELQQFAKTFYSDGETASLAAAIEPVLALTDLPGAPALAMRLARDVREDHQEQLGDLLRRAPANFRDHLGYLVDRWKQYDARKYADAFVARASIGQHIAVTGKEERHG